MLTCRSVSPVFSLETYLGPLYFRQSPHHEATCEINQYPPSCIRFYLECPKWSERIPAEPQDPLQRTSTVPASPPRPHKNNFPQPEILNPMQLFIWVVPQIRVPSWYPCIIRVVI